MVTADALHSMKKMAADPKRRAALAKDATCIGGMVVVMSNSDNKIVALALETLLLLVEGGENIQVLRESMGMLDQLATLLPGHKSGRKSKVRTLAEKLYSILTDVDSTTPLKDTSNVRSTRRNTSSNTSNNCSKRCDRSLRSHKHMSVILQLRGLSDRNDRELCMRLLLQVKGVISITFDIKKKRCILRVKIDVKPESLVQAVARSQTMSAQQVVRDDNGDELLLSFRSGYDEEKENSHMPSYLSDDSDMPAVADNAVACPTKGDKQDGGWLSSASSFIANSFYW